MAPVAHSDTELAAVVESESRIESAGRLGIVGQLADSGPRDVLHFATYWQEQIGSVPGTVVLVGIGVVGIAPLVASVLLVRIDSLVAEP